MPANLINNPSPYPRFALPFLASWTSTMILSNRRLITVLLLCRTEDRRRLLLAVILVTGPPVLHYLDSFETYAQRCAATLQIGEWNMDRFKAGFLAAISQRELAYTKPELSWDDASDSCPARESITASRTYLLISLATFILVISKKSSQGSKDLPCDDESYLD
ncbi:hypothetical protein K474DRAFT_298034 [Panus rudis PR-1116 ss-1]|nr:hypothetical protein K474DRAFT_298034 [Panus rudis PR-1116 ss-1]